MVFEIGLRGALAEHVSFLVTISEVTWQVTISLRLREYLTERDITATIINITSLNFATLLNNSIYQLIQILLASLILKEQLAEQSISSHCILDLSADRLHRKYRRLRKYPNHVTEVCKFRNRTVFRQ